MQATVKYDLSETGRKASLIAGGDGKREQVAMGEVDAAALDILSVGSDGKVSGDATHEFVEYGRTSKYFDAPQSLADLIVFLRAQLATQTARDAAKAAADAAQKETENKLASQRRALEQEFFADPTARAYTTGYGRDEYKWRDVYWNSYNRSADREFCRVARERNEADKEAKEAAAETAKAKFLAEQRAFFAAWLSEHGTDNQRERDEAGLLSTEEIKTAIRDHIFAAIADAELYKKITHAECHDDDCSSCYDDCKMDCDVDESINLTAEEWDNVKALRGRITAMIPEATTKIRLHSCTVSCCDGKAERLGLLVTVERPCELKFSREFAV